MSLRPAFPSASQAPQRSPSALYEKACRHVLSQRFGQILGGAAIMTAVFVPVSTWSLQGGVLYYLFSSALHVSFAFIFGVLPTLLARKLRRRALPSPRPKTLAGEISSISPLYVGLHAFSGLAICFFYATFVTRNVSGSRLSLFTGSHRHPWSLNERHFTLLAGNFCLGVVYSSWDAVRNRNPLWLRRYGGLTQRKKTARWESGIRCFWFAISHYVVFLSAYLLLRVPIWALINRALGFLASPFLHFIVRPGAYRQIFSVSLWSRTFLLQFSTILLWDIAGTSFEIDASQVIHLSQFQDDPNASLIAGLQSKEGYFKYFAFAELANVVANRPPRRKALFSDLKANPSAWEQVCRECLLLIGQDYSAVANRDTPPPAAPPAVAAPPPASHASKTSKDSIYKAPSTASSGPLDTFVGAANAVATVMPANLSVPAIFLNSSHSQPIVPVQIPASVQGWKLPKPDLNGIANMLPPKVLFWSKRIWDALFKEREDAKLEALLANRAADIWAIEALSTLVTYSLHEDPYGRVQCDIPRVLEALISYLGALEQLIDQTNASPTPDTEEAVKKVVQPVADALREGIRMIVLEFGPRLAAFTFPPRIARRLQAMVDYL